MTSISSEDWRPTCSCEILRLRARMLTAVRVFFADRHYLEVDTPLLSCDIVIDAHVDPFSVTAEPSESPFFLQTSPEALMKRMVAAGSGSIFQITHSFRKGETGQRHNPEFTMLEWYGIDTSYHDQMTVVQDLVHYVTAAVAVDGSGLPGTELLQETFSRTTYNDAFLRTLRAEVLDLSDADIMELASRHAAAESCHTDAERDDLLNLMLAECIEPTLGQNKPEFLIDYPVTQAALAQVNPADPRTACRFELYADGIELCNGYQELTDPAELARRDEIQNRNRSAHGMPVLPGAMRLAAAMNSGLPPCSGVALGFDRLVMVLAGLNDISHAIPFPVSRA
ncbi:MAG: EF-P lysine aminoacylase GenX [Fuerstiella sp.]|nr:EF-P lysine aminoacylase GenX [Fuerstiella sp.]MCP4854671.1 EF-P lysine aminoacylase GenX [Fuerstiella sp.]